MSLQRAAWAALAAMALSACLAEPAQRADIVSVGQECPDSVGVGAYRYVPEAGCLDGLVILCTAGGVLETFDCAEDADTGALYQTNYPVDFSRTEAWIRCEREDWERVMNARPCGE